MQTRRNMVQSNSITDSQNSLQAASVPEGARSLSVHETDALLLVDGGLRPGVGMWMGVGITLICGLGNPEPGCLDPDIRT